MNLIFNLFVYTMSLDRFLLRIVTIYSRLFRDRNFFARKLAMLRKQVAFGLRV